MEETEQQKKTFWTLAVVLLVFAAAYRVVRAVAVPELPNFSPVMAMAFCAGWFLPLRFGVVAVFGALLVSDLWIGMALGHGFGMYLLAQYLLYGFAMGLGWWLGKGGFHPVRFFGGVLWAAIVFYVVTNTGAWVANPGYAKTIGGWIQALSTGIPGYPPTWTFFRNSLFSDLLFSGTFLAAWKLSGLPGRKKVGARSGGSVGD